MAVSKARWEKVFRDRVSVFYDPGSEPGPSPPEDEVALNGQGDVVHTVKTALNTDTQAFTPAEFAAIKQTGMMEPSVYLFATEDERRYGIFPRVYSASQLETWTRCKRAWWFDKVVKVPAVEKGYLVFGTVLHSVLERYLRADDTGRNPDGTVADLYPEGWSDGIEPDLAAHIQMLVKLAVEEGVLQRLPNRLLEQEFWMPLFHVEGHDKPVMVMGFIDYLLPDEVQDHKSTKTLDYKKGPKALLSDIQLLLYAKCVLECARQNGVKLDKVKVRLNYYVKTALEVDCSEAVIPVDVIEDFWKTLHREVRAMEAFRQEWPAARAEEWAKTPPPEDYVAACSKYGGCPYRPICGETVKTVQEHVFNTNRLIADQEATRSGKPLPVIQQATQEAPSYALLTALLGSSSISVNNGPQETTMPTIEDLFSARAAENAASAGVIAMMMPAPTQAGALNPTPAPAATPTPAPATPSPAPSPTPVVGAEVSSVPPAPVKGRPVHACSDCTSCAGTGFNTHGGACRICNSRRRKAKQPTSDVYEIVVENGTIIYEVRAEHAAVMEALVGGDAGGEFTLSKVAEAHAATAPATNGAAAEAPKRKRRTKAEMEADAAAAAATPAPSAVPSPAPTQPVIALPSAPAPTPSPAPAPTPAAAQTATEPASVVFQEKYATIIATKGAQADAPPWQGFILVFGSYPAKLPRAAKHFPLDDIFEHYARLMATEEKSTSYYLLDAFKRRDNMLASVSKIAATFSHGTILTLTGDGRDLRDFAAALVPHASLVLGGFGSGR